MKKFAPIAVTVALLATFITTSSQAVDINKYVWPPVYNTMEQQNGPHLGYAVGIVDDFTQGAGAMEANSFISVSGNIQPLCTGFTDPVCVAEINAGRGDWWSNVAFAPCKAVNQLSACVEAVRIQSKDGTLRDLKLKKVIPGNYWPADPTIGLPEGSAPSLWVDPNETDPNKGFLVAATGGMAAIRQGAVVKDVFLFSFQSSISPYEMISEPGTRGLSTAIQNGVRKFSGGSGSHCIWADTGECGVQTDFAEDTRLQLVLHLPSNISSWLIGRMKAPDITVTKLSNTGNLAKDISRVSITAQSVEIPMISAKVDLADMSAEQKKHYADPEKNMGDPNWPNNLHGYRGSNSASSYEYSFEMYELFKKQWPEKAQLMLPRWSVRSLGSDSPAFSKCRESSPGKFQGVVTTNASIYQGNPPTFDGESFSYKVAGVHKKTNGDVFQGSYDLILDSKFARCLYKFTSAPIRASVSITNADGNSNIESTVFNEKDGWVRLSIAGFTFSSPKIKIKLNQAGSGVAKATTITCIKGKVTKKITAVNPKCPAGYKKK